MNEMEGRLPDLRKSFSWVIFGIVVTVAYGAIVCWVWSESGSQESPKLIELADALAGLFAPPAFLWLCVATMVQAQELSLQRRELQLTRREFEQSREVARLQAEEAKNQAAFIGTQTKILVMQQADRHVDVLLDNLVSFIRTNFSEQVVVRADDGDSFTSPHLYQVQGTSDPATVFSNFSKAAQQVRLGLQTHPDWTPYGRVSRFGLLVKRVMELQAILPEATPAKNAFVSACGFGHMAIDASFLWNTCKEAGF